MQHSSKLYLTIFLHAHFLRATRYYSYKVYVHNILIGPVRADEMWIMPHAVAHSEQCGVDRLFLLDFAA